MTRPAPRKSSLAGSNPVAPPSAAPAVDATSWTRPAQEEADRERDARKSTKWRHKGVC